VIGFCVILLTIRVVGPINFKGLSKKFATA
jgi:hypothetical protein